MDSESIETAIQRRRKKIAGFVARMREERPPRRVMFKELARDKSYFGGQHKRLDGAPLGNITGFGMKCERCMVEKACTEGRQMI